MIRESMERGEFDDLPGSGEPIDLTESPYEKPELRSVHRLLRNAGFAPPWIEERKDIEDQLQKAYSTLSRARQLYCQTSQDPENREWQRAIKEFRERVDQLNQRIRIYNLKAPSASVHRQLIDVDKLVSELK
jgi:hypothetical protein